MISQSKPFTYLTDDNCKRISLLASSLLREVWKERKKLWPNEKISYFQALSPEAAAQVLGIKYEEHETLDTSFGYRGTNVSIAGLIDRHAKKIAVSKQFNPQAMRFTAAHEIGHWILHPDNVINHRDRPVLSQYTSEKGRSLDEKEADYFASCFLMPATFVTQEMKKMFGFSEQLILDENLAFHLRNEDPQSLMLAEENSIDREVAVAAFNFRHRTESLAEKFKVSPVAMGIKIKELQLIKWP